MSLLLKSALLLTMEEGKEPFTGDLLIEGDTIAQIGRIDLSRAMSEPEVIDCRGLAAMPGLVNTHNHTPMSLLRSFSDGLPLREWLNRKMLPAEAKMNEEDTTGARCWASPR